MFMKRHLRTSLILCGTLSLLILQACSTVRDVTDWVPGVDSNEEIQAEKEQQQKQEKDKAYPDKAVFEAKMTGPTAENDALINVKISQQYVQESIIKREDIGIEVNAGVVTLTGSVATEESAVQAIFIAKNTAGVSMVISKLVVIKLREK